MAAEELLPPDELLVLGELDGPAVGSLDGSLDGSGGAAAPVALLLGAAAPPDADAGAAELVDVW